MSLLPFGSAPSPISNGTGGIAQNSKNGILMGSNSTILSGTVNPTTTATLGNPGSIYMDSTNGLVYFKNDSGTTTNWTAITTGAVGGYFNGYLGLSGSNYWTTSSTSFAALTATGGTSSLTTRVSGGLSVSAASSNGAGITFTPASNSAVYVVSATGNVFTNMSSDCALRLTDGTNQIANVSFNPIGDAVLTAQILGVYAPATASPVTVSVQGLSSSGGALQYATTGVPGWLGIEWQVIQINVGSSPGTGITRIISSVSTNTIAGALSETDYVYFVSGTTTLTLPTAVGNTNLYTIKNTGSNTVSVATVSGQTIDGSASPISLPTANQSIDVLSDQSNWRIV